MKELRRSQWARRTGRGGVRTSKARNHGHGRCGLCNERPLNKALKKTKGQSKHAGSSVQVVSHDPVLVAHR